MNGTDDGEVGIQGWQVCISGGPQGFAPYCTTTDKNGVYSFSGLDDGTYAVCEIIPSLAPVWVPTTPTSIANVTVGPDASYENFGNVCLGAGGGLTLGFWSNKNGQALISGGQLCWFNALFLRNADGSNFDPVLGCPNPSSTQIGTGKTTFRNWILAANATNMAYMLSAQFAAMRLNVWNGKVDGNAKVYAPACGNTGPGNAFISINDLLTAADAQLAANPVTVSGNPNRAPQECLKNALDSANNNLNFVQPSACAVNYTGTETCTP